MHFRDVNTQYYQEVRGNEEIISLNGEDYEGGERRLYRYQPMRL